MSWFCKKGSASPRNSPELIMSRRWFSSCIVLIAVTLAVALPTGVFAAAPTQTNVVAMQGQGSVVGSQYQPQLKLKLAAADSSGWLLELALNPGQTQTGSGGIAVLNLGGTFVLGMSGRPLSHGTASGSIDQSGHGDLRLSDASTSTSLDVPFSIDTTGTISSATNGQWPADPVKAVPSPTLTVAQPTSHFFWYLSRTSGMLSYIILFLSLCLGVAFKSQRKSLGGGSWRILDLHKFLAVLGLALIALHVFSLLGDKYSKLTLAQLLVPMISTYRPVSLATGIIAFYISLAAVVAWSLRRSIGNRTWRIIHASGIAVFILGLAHAIASGTDTSSVWTQLLYAITGGVAVFAGLLQLSRHLRPSVPLNAEPIK